MLYAFFRVIPWHLSFVCRHFGTLRLFHLPSYPSAYEDGTERLFRNTGVQNSDAGELPRRKHTTSYTCFEKINHSPPGDILLYMQHMVFIMHLQLLATSMIRVERSTLTVLSCI